MADTEKKQFVNSKGDTWEYEETEEMRKAVERLHQTIRELEAKAPCLLYTSPSPRDATLSRMPSSA